jgi:F-type H+-transporting ATPase subunit gamma
MQMVAASKMRKAQAAALAGRPFAQLLYRIQREATGRSEELHHPLLEVRPVEKRAVILVGSDRGLCGALNSNLFRRIVQYDPASTVFIAAGRRVAQFIARTGRQLAAEFPYGDSPTYADARAIAAFARDLFLKREVDEVEIVFTRFVNTLTQEALSAEFLPVGVLKIPGVEPEEALKTDDAECLFEPDAEAVSFPCYLNLFIYLVLHEAKASEQAHAWYRHRVSAPHQGTDAGIQQAETGQHHEGTAEIAGGRP